MTRFHYAFDEFENTQCSADLFYRNTDIWKLDDVCPAPKTWVPYVAPEYSTYQSLPSYIREKRKAECEKDDPKKKGCATDGRKMSIDVQECKRKNLYSPEEIRGNKRNRVCCLVGNFEQNAIAQGRATGTGRRRGKNNFKATRDACCEEYSDLVGGVNALTTIGCRFNKKMPSETDVAA